jgi:carboxypeptidase family protein
LARLPGAKLLDMRRWIRFGFFFIAFGCCPGVWGQKTGDKSAVTVVVTDPSGAMIPHAEVKIVPVPVGAPGKLETGEAGKLAIDLGAGEYNITVREQGFRTATKHIFVQSAASQTVGVVLQVGGCPPDCHVEVTPVVPPDAVPVLAPAADVPAACSRADMAKYGRPVMFSRRGGLAYGVSMARDHFRADEEARIYIWLSNESAFADDRYSCCEMSFLSGIQVVDGNGLLLETGREILERKIRQEGHEPVTVCTCSGSVSLAPGRCGVVDSGTLNRRDTAYDLAPGDYFVVERTPKPSVDPSRSLLRNDPQEKVPGLAITIEKP